MTKRAGETVYPYRPHRLFLLAPRPHRPAPRRSARAPVRRPRSAWRLPRGAPTCPGARHYAEEPQTASGRPLRPAPRCARPGASGALRQGRGALPTLQAERDAEAGVADAWLFPDATGEPMDGDNFRARVWEPLSDRAEVRKMRLHDLRHSAASSCLLQAGVGCCTSRSMLGHHSAAFTLRSVRPPTPERPPRGGERLDRPAIRTQARRNTPRSNTIPRKRNGLQLVGVTGRSSGCGGRI